MPTPRRACPRTALRAAQQCRRARPLTVWYERIAAEAASDGIETLRPVRSRRLQTMTSLQALVPLHANEVDASGERSSVGHVDEELACGFLGDEWIAVCVEGSREITRVTCGGWKRPYDMHVAAGRRGGRTLDPRSAGGLEPAVRLAFAFLRGGKCTCTARGPRALACGPLVPRRMLSPKARTRGAQPRDAVPRIPHGARGAWLVTASEDSVRAFSAHLRATDNAVLVSAWRPGSGATLRCVARAPRAVALRRHAPPARVWRRLALSLMAWDIVWRHEGATALGHLAARPLVMDGYPRRSQPRITPTMWPRASRRPGAPRKPSVEQSTTTIQIGRGLGRWCRRVGGGN